MVITQVGSSKKKYTTLPPPPKNTCVNVKRSDRHNQCDLTVSLRRKLKLFASLKLKTITTIMINRLWSLALGILNGIPL